MNWLDLCAFVRESNAIEGIERDPYHMELLATEGFLNFERLEVGTVQSLVAHLEPEARLRRHPGMDVHVGSYVAPKGGTHIEAALMDQLDYVNRGQWSPYEALVNYQRLHPFTDCNGRSGRAIWLWMHKGCAPRGFLHEWWYETLRAADARGGP